MVVALRKEYFVSSKKTEYDVYIYNRHPEDNEAGEPFPCWERKARTRNMRRALLKAKHLHEKDHYERVEVKKRILDAAKNCKFSYTFRVYDSSSKPVALWVFAAGVLFFIWAVMYAAV